MNRFGHCENYSFSLELETAIAQATEEVHTLLSTQIVQNQSFSAVFHSEFDNFDQLLNNLTGMSSIHTTHGIMLQEIKGSVSDLNDSLPTIPSVSRTHERSLKVQSPEACLIAMSHIAKVLH